MSRSRPARVGRSCRRPSTHHGRSATDRFASRPKLRWRGQLLATLDDVGAGCHSTLELTYVRDVERRHGLPTAARQTIRVRRGGRWYSDVEYTDYSTIVELDGPPAHPDEGAGA